MLSRRFWLVVFLPALAFLVVFFYYPVTLILEDGLSVSAISSVLSNPYYRHVIAFTILQAVGSTLLTLAIGLPGAYLFAKYDFPGKRTLKAILTVPFVMPSIMVALGFILLFGREGFFTSILGRNLGILYSWKAILLAHAFYNFPVVVRMVSSLWERINPHYEEAAMSLGARGFTLFRKVTLPMLYPAILASSLLTFIFSFLSFSIPLILGGYRYSTIEVAIFTSIMTLLDFRTGAALAVIQMTLSFTFMYLYLKSLDRYSKAEEQRILREPRRLKLKDMLSLKGLGITIYSAIVFVFILSPLLAVVYDSITWKGKFTLEFYRRLFDSSYNPIFGSDSLHAIAWTFAFGFATVLLATLIALAIAYSALRWDLPGKTLVDVLATLPLGSSAIVIGLGYIKAFHRPPLLLLGSPYLIVAAHTVIAYPFALRAVSSSLRKVKSSLREAAMSLGATDFKAFLKVELPLAFGGVLVGAVFSFAMSIAELGATYMIYQPEYTTITIAIYRYLGSRQFGSASAMAVILMIVSLVGFLLIERTGEEVW
ncbi:ABC transporter permease [Thermococcus gammatolerans]|uniref:ABC-type transport system, permease component n=1 Tax=Thermococcus gammatolerans (strain DSM 15229 / JCM 11827 / EJ3) TaxID=593117 RepID=C5A7J4_THEGJ|nr:iron ABC transporter permease [Thermococcus gammatolerans]ACS34206.1 ABC-type transport system, permease component [Thermococcus gammatolerans EJ3]